MDNLDRISRVSDRLKDYRGASIKEWIALIRIDPPAFKKIVRKLLNMSEVNDVNFWGYKIK